MLFPGSNPQSDFRSELSRRMLGQRTIMISQAISSQVAGQVSQQLTVLASESSEPIRLLVSNAPGGDVEAALSVYDLMRSLDPPVTAVASGRVQGAGVVLFCGVERENRYALPNARFGFEEPRVSASDDPSPQAIESQADVQKNLRERVRRLLIDATGQGEDTVDDDVRSRRAFSAEEAAEYGLVHRVVQSAREIE